MASDVFGLVGSTLREQYRVNCMVSEGGFGVVYRGFHLSFEHHIAIKCLKVPTHFTVEAQQLFFDRFREEGKLLSRLSEHPSIVRVFDFGVVKDRRGINVPYLVLEWLEGHDLEWELRQRGRPYTEQEAISMLRPAIDAVAHAHLLGIAHRDIKPANLFLSQGSRGTTLKVLDFGIAKAMQEGETATQVATKTSSGFSSYSPQYAAPEQFSPKKFGPTGPWTDVHALGLMLVELVTGRPALAGEEQSDWLMASISDRRPTPRAKGVMVSEWFENVCARALAQMPAHRFANAGQLLAALSVGTIAAAPSITVLQAPVQTVLTPAQQTQMALAMQRQAPIELAFGQSEQAFAGTIWPQAKAKGEFWSKLSAETGVGEGLVVLGAIGFVVFIVSLAVMVPRLTKGASSGLVGTMKAIPGGTFMMDSADGDDNEEAPHKVTVRAFEMDETEVTVAQYRACVKDGACSRPHRGGLCNWEESNRDEHPINCVDWNEASAYCKWAKKRLPTEEEWEYAARGTDGRTYPWGNDEPREQLCWDGEGNSAGKLKRPSTCEVRAYPAGKSPFGLLDMAGNVWEWTASEYSDDYDQPRQDKLRVVRGGSWFSIGSVVVRAASRDKGVPSGFSAELGFRCAR